MQWIIFLSAAVAMAATAPQRAKESVPQIIKYESNNNIDDGYNFMFETSDGKYHREVAQIVNPGTEDEAIEIQGEYYYPGEGGYNHVTYTAGRNGYVPKVEFIPDTPNAPSKVL